VSAVLPEQAARGYRFETGNHGLAAQRLLAKRPPMRLLDNMIPWRITKRFEYRRFQRKIERLKLTKMIQGGLGYHENGNMVKW
jgi:hypothetical protein